MKKVSVIIPSYGSGSNPCRAVDSVLAQDYENIEAVIVDDNGKGSNQQLKNVKLFERYINNSKVKYIVHDVNKNGSAARNTGARASDGDYLCFLDDDDEFTDISKISLQMKAADKLGDDWAGTYSSLVVYKDGKLLNSCAAGPSGYILVEMIRDKLSIGTGAPLISRKSYEAIGGFNESFLRHQDWEFFARLLDRYKLMAVPEASYSRYYKADTKRKDADTRLEYMDKYVSYMYQEIKSISPQKLSKLMKEKYSGVILGYLGEKNFSAVLEICKKHHFNINDYLSVFASALSVSAKKIRHKLKKGDESIG